MNDIDFDAINRAALSGGHQFLASRVGPRIDAGPDTVSHLSSVRHTTVSMTNPSNRVEVITSIQRRRRWTALEKVRMVGSGAISTGR